VHEVSLVRSLLEQVNHIVAEQGGRAAVEVRVEIGPLSGVEPLLVREAFTQLDGDGTLIIEEVPLVARCDSCDIEFEVENFRFVCPRCESRETRVIRGDAFRLMSVTVDVPEDVADPRIIHESLPAVSA
jgi:hydrogenase nickel incorporation protein HypA/HybF